MVGAFYHTFSIAVLELVESETLVFASSSLLALTDSTSDPFVPDRVRYQAAVHAEFVK